MLKLDLSPQPRWIDLMPGVRLLVEPVTTTAMMLARSRVRASSPDEDGFSDEQLGVELAKEVARSAILEWDGVGDASGIPVPVTPEGIDALMENFAAFQSFQSKVIEGAIMLEQEKNVSAPSPNGTSARAAGKITAQAAQAPAKNARTS